MIPSRDFKFLPSFVAFVNAQPAGRPVHHATWNTCAVADFAREVHGLMPMGVTSRLYEEVGSASGDRVFYMGLKGLSVKLTYEHSMMDVLASKIRYGRATYGQLRLALGEQFPDLGFKNSAPQYVVSKWRNFMDRIEQGREHINAGA